MTNRKLPFSIWWTDKAVLIPTEKSGNNIHRYLIVSADERGRGEDIATCVPISTNYLNAFSVRITASQSHGALEHPSHFFCDHIISFRMKHLTTRLGYVSDKKLIQSIKDTVALWLGV